MVNLINVMHPYIFKLQIATLVIGPLEEYKERDKKIAAFIRCALRNQARILVHRRTTHDSLAGVLGDTAFLSDPMYVWLSDTRMDTVVTTKYGIPLPNKKPRDLTEDEWLEYTKVFTTEEQFRKERGDPTKTFFIGGAL